MSLPRWLAGFALLTAATLARADYQVTLSDVHMCCKGCGVGINIDTNRLANAAEEMRRALEKVPPEITIKFFR